MLPEGVSNFLGNFADIVGLLGAFFALFAWLQARRLGRDTRREQERLDQEIEILIKEESGRKCVPVPGRLRRRSFVRSEILGFIGMIPTLDGHRFELAYISDERFFHDLKRIQDSTQTELMVIECTADELEQFEADKIMDCHA